MREAVRRVCPGSGNEGKRPPGDAEEEERDRFTNFGENDAACLKGKGPMTIGPLAANKYARHLDSSLYPVCRSLSRDFQEHSLALVNVFFFV